MVVVVVGVERNEEELRILLAQTLDHLSKDEILLESQESDQVVVGALSVAEEQLETRWRLLEPYRLRLNRKRLLDRRFVDCCAELGLLRYYRKGRV